MSARSAAFYATMQALGETVRSGTTIVLQSHNDKGADRVWMTVAVIDADDQVALVSAPSIELALEFAGDGLTSFGVEVFLNEDGDVVGARDIEGSDDE